MYPNYENFEIIIENVTQSSTLWIADENCFVKVNVEVRNEYTWVNIFVDGCNVLTSVERGLDSNSGYDSILIPVKKGSMISCELSDSFASVSLIKL